MHAHLCPHRPALPVPAGVAHALLAPVGTGPTLRLTLWHDPLEAAAERDLVGGRLYDVEAVLAQPPSGQVARAASVTEFDGPRDDAQVAADRTSSYDRVWPAAAQVPGVLGALQLRALDGGMVVVALADSVATLQQAVRTIVSTPLLPGEDPARLTGPDRHADFLLTDGGLAAVLTGAVAAR